MSDQKTDLVINSFLCYASTVRHDMKYEDITRICIAFYKESDLLEGKKLICENLGEKPKWRRGDQRLVHEVQDVLNLLKKCDDESITLPSFVCDSYNGMPPTSGFEIIAQPLVSLINDIADLRKEVELLRESRQTEILQNQDSAVIQEDIIIIKGELRKLNHRIMSDDLKRNSLVMQSLDCINRKESNIDPGSKDFVRLDCSSGVEAQPGVILSPSAPPASQESWHLMDRLLCDDGGAPSAPSYADVVSEM